MRYVVYVGICLALAPMVVLAIRETLDHRKAARRERELAEAEQTLRDALGLGFSANLVAFERIRRENERRTPTPVSGAHAPTRLTRGHKTQMEEADLANFAEYDPRRDVIRH